MLIHPELYSFRTVYETGGSELSIRVLGFHHGMEGVTGAPEGHSQDWFCFIFHDRVPVMVGGVQVIAQPGNVMIVPPQSLIYHGRCEPWCRSWLRFSGRDLDVLLQQTGLQKGVLIAVDHPELHDHWLLALHKELNDPHGSDEMILRHLLYCWWKSIARASVIPFALSEEVMRAKALIEQNYQNGLTLDWLCKQVKLSRTHLCRLFMKAFGFSPMLYAQKLRIQHAADLLKGTTWPIAEVARQSGYEDVHYFSKLFKQERGIPPRNFRKN